MVDVQEWVKKWMPQFEYYTEDAYVPTGNHEMIMYYRCARNFLSDKLVELYALYKLDNRESTK